MKSECFLSVIIPAFNEAARLKKTLPVLREFLRQSDFTWEVVLADDGSEDNTSKIPQKIFTENEFRVVRHEINRGKGYTVRQGIKAARGEICLITDADFSTPISEFTKLKTFLDQGYDIAIGSRSLPESNVVIPQKWYRHLLGDGFRLLVKTLGLADFIDTQCGFKCFRREKAFPVFSKMRINGFCFDVEFLFIANKWGLKIKEVPVEWHNCTSSKVHVIWSPIQMFRDLIRIRVNAFRGIYKQRCAGSGLAED